MYNTANSREQGGEVWNIGGTLNVLSGGSINLLNGSTVKSGTTEVSFPTILSIIESLTTKAELDGSTGKKACLTKGISEIAGGTGIADMTLGAGTPGSIAIIRLASITSGSVVVTCGTVTYTFEQAEDTIILIWTGTEWSIALNSGVVVGTAGES